MVDQASRGRNGAHKAAAEWFIADFLSGIRF
jgi:hypothetical protein